MIIGFTGKAGCGKTSVASGVSQRIYSFAGRLKETAVKMGWNGVKDDKGRRLLQDLGSLGREYKKSLWVDYTVHDILDDVTSDKYYGDDYVYSVDDLRYDNEAEAIHSMDGIIIRLEHHAVCLGELDEHASEKGILDCYVDYTVPWGNLKDVIKRAEEIIEIESNRASKEKARK